MRVTNVDRVHCIARAVVGLRARPAPSFFSTVPIFSPRINARDSIHLLFPDDSTCSPDSSALRRLPLHCSLPPARRRAPVKPAPPAHPEVAFEESSFDRLPQIQDHTWEPALAAFQRSCEVMHGRPRSGTDVCRSALATDPIGAQRFFLANFTPWKVFVANDDATLVQDTGLMTGYYEPELLGSRTRSAPFTHPIYGVPDDLLVIDLAELYPQLKELRLRGKLEGRRVVPYDDRATIQKRTDLAPRAIAWVNDPVDAFFLHIQGSGRIRLPDGTFMRVGFADQNGRKYHSIGTWLIREGHLKSHELSMQRIRRWARENPSRVDEALAQNPSYVFFEERKGSPDLGPLGAQGVPLTPEASVAVDLRYWRLGTPFIVDASQASPALKIVRPVIAQDTGGAIRGIIRFDYFWGFGDKAGEAAGARRATHSPGCSYPTA